MKKENDFVPVDIPTIIGNDYMDNIVNLNSNLCIPSFIHSQSMAVEYMKQWFLSKFNPKYFKSIFIDGRNILSDFKNMNADVNQKLKVIKPALAIEYRTDYDYNRDNLDLYQFGTQTYVRRSRFENSFFKDRKNNVYLALNLQQLQVNFTFKMKVSTKAKQADLYAFVKNTFRVGATISDYIDMDVHIPYNLILQIANDTGFEIKNEKITNIIGFLKYLNSHSLIPIFYKYRAINGRNEFFLRLSDMYVHISNLDNLDVDDGETQNMINTNFIIQMNTILHIPAPKIYAYYSTTDQNIIDKEESDEPANQALYSIKINKFPEYNEKNWNIFITTQVYEDDFAKALVIDFNSLFKNSELEKVINYAKSRGISPAMFIDFKLYNNFKYVDYIMNWDTFVAHTKIVTQTELTDIAVYVDLKYYNSVLAELNDMKNNRMISKGAKIDRG